MIIDRPTAEEGCGINGGHQSVAGIVLILRRSSHDNWIGDTINSVMDIIIIENVSVHNSVLPHQRIARLSLAGKLNEQW